MKRVKSKKTGEVFTVVSEDDKGILFSDGRVRKHETVAEYFEEVRDASKEEPGADGPADDQGGTGKAPRNGLGAYSADSGAEEEDAGRDAGPITATRGPLGGDGSPALED